MHFQQPLNRILDSGVKVRVLRFLCQKGGEWNGRRIAAEVAVHPTTAHKALRELRQATVLNFKRVGNSFVYSLRDEHVLVRESLRPLFQQEAQAHTRLVAVLRRGLNAKLRSSVVSAAIYGSLARHQERPTSDIDLLVLVRSAQAKQVVRGALDHLGETVMRIFGNPLALYVNTVHEARQKAQRGLPVFTHILRDHHLLWGRSLHEALHGR